MNLVREVNEGITWRRFIILLENLSGNSALAYSIYSKKNKKEEIISDEAVAEREVSRVWG